MELILSFLFIVILIYLADRYFLNYWSRLGVKQVDGSFLFGNIKDVILQRRSMATVFKELHDATKKERFVGVYLSYRPALLVNDPKMIRDILIKDFMSFHDRGIYADEKNDILTGNIWTLSGQRWKDLRVKLSSLFTSVKLKRMFPTLVDCANVFQKYIEDQVKSGNNIMDIYEIAARFTTKCISSVAFGVEIDCINDPNHIFRDIERKAFTVGF
jgi:cytochrome P450 family 6